MNFQLIIEHLLEYVLRFIFENLETYYDIIFVVCVKESFKLFCVFLCILFSFFQLRIYINKLS